MDFEEHHIQVRRSARYATLGRSSDRTERVWFVCHGYSQLALDFVRYFKKLDNGRHLVVAPEALSRFYLDSGRTTGREAGVGATWMTREDRLHEIADYIGYLDTLYEHVFETLDRDRVHVVALGFSQGSATVSRWVQQGRARVDHLVLWGGLLPPEIDVGKVDLRAERMTIVVGDSDPLVSASQVDEQERRLEAANVSHEIVRFVGGHHLNQRVLLRLAGE